MNVIRPQKGAQEAFLASSADIVIYGGAAGSGKTYAILLEPLRHINNPNFGAVIFRREATQITNEGGLWDTAMGIYPLITGEPKQTPRLNFTFKPGSRVTFAHLNYDSSVLDWQGSQIPLIIFDELTHFTRNQFFYMMSRNRSACGVRPYIRATTNPDAESWVAEFIDWWIGKDGYPIKERSGKIRWFCRVNDVIYWGDSADQLAKDHGIDKQDCKSLTFIAASVFDNPALLKADPGYLSNLKALSRVERERLLNGNWKIKASAGEYFNRTDVEIIDEMPREPEIMAYARAWDLAATEPHEQNSDPDWTAGVKMARTYEGKTIICDLQHFRKKASEVRKRIISTAQQDGPDVRISIPEDPGQAGKEQAQSYVADLSGYSVFTRKPQNTKINRAEPFAAQWQNGLVQVLRAPWNDALFAELESFPDSAHDDIVDACSDAFASLPAANSASVDAVGEMESSNVDW